MHIVLPLRISPHMQLLCNCSNKNTWHLYLKYIYLKIAPAKILASVTQIHLKTSLTDILHPYVKMNAITTLTLVGSPYKLVPINYST